MVRARRAGPGDAAEIARLRVRMSLDMGFDAALMDAAWQAMVIRHFAARLADRDDFAAFVVDAPHGGLAATAVGWVERHLPAGNNPSGERGHIANMSTDPAWRRRGYGRASLVALLDWMRERGLKCADLNASADGEPLYRSLGFRDPTMPALTLNL